MRRDQCLTMRGRGRHIAIGAAAIAVVLAFGVGAVQAQNKCLAGKTKCVNKKVAGLLKCAEKCQKDPAMCGTVQIGCEGKVRAKFDGDGIDPATSCFSKLEAKNEGPCKTTGDRAVMESRADTFVAGVVGALAGTRFVDNGDGTVTDNQTGLQWEKKTGIYGSTKVCTHPNCPAGDTFTGTYTVSAPCAGGTLTLVVSPSGTSWTGTVVDSGVFCGTISDFSGAISGTALTGSGYGGTITLSGTVDCGQAKVSGTFSGALTGSWTATTGYCPDPHDVSNAYAWSATGTLRDGGVVTDFLAKLNACTSGDGTTITGGFAGHCDWRLPTSAELQTLLLAPYSCGMNPCIDPIFGPTASFYYWSSTVGASDPSRPWGADFSNGKVEQGAATSTIHVRAVRGGS